MEATPPTKGAAMWRPEYAVLKQATIQPRERKMPKIIGRHGRCKRRRTKKWPRQKQETQTQPEAGDTRQAHRRHKTIEGRQQRRGAMELAETALRPPEATVWFRDIELHPRLVGGVTQLQLKLHAPHWAACARTGLLCCYTLGHVPLQPAWGERTCFFHFYI